MFIIFLILLKVVMGGGNPALIKIALREIPPFTFNFLRFAIAFLFFTPLLIRKKIRFNQNIRGVVFLSLLLTSNIMLFNFGVQRTTATIGQMLYAVAPIMTAALSYFLLEEKFNTKKISGIIIGFIGTLLIIILPLIETRSPFKGDLLGNLLIFIGVICISIYAVFSKKFQKDYSPTDLTFYFVSVTLVTQLFFASTELSTYQTWWSTLSLEALFGLVYVGALGTAGFYFIYQFIIKHSTPLIATSSLYLQPIAAFVWAAILLNERLTFGFIIGAILTFLGVLLVISSTREKELIAELKAEEIKT